MTDRYLYVCPIPNDAQSETGARTRKQLAAQGLLNSDSGAVESISTSPGEQTLELTYMGPFAEKLATEVEELSASSSAVPYYAEGESSPVDGYYTVESADVGREVPQTESFASVDVTLTREGTFDGEQRAVETTDAQVENDFGNDQTALVGVPTAASDVQWFDSESGQTEDVSVVETRVGEYGDVDIVDVKASSFDNPTLVYEIPYDGEWQTAVHAFDSRGLASKTDSDGILQWMRVFRTGHDFAGSAVVSNRLVRLEFDAATNMVVVEEWDSSGSAWSSVVLGTSNWEFAGVDVTRISPSRVDAQVRFQNPTTSPTEVFHLDMSVKRGWTWPLWTVPANEQGPTPSGLQDLLGPVASGSDFHAQAEQGLVARQEVRK